MIVEIINRHCDPRNITVPGTCQIVRLPAGTPVEIFIATKEQMGELYEKLSSRAPAAQVRVLLGTRLNDEDESPDDLQDGGTSNDVVEEDVAMSVEPETQPPKDNAPDRHMADISETEPPPAKQPKQRKLKRSKKR